MSIGFSRCVTWGSTFFTSGLGVAAVIVASVVSVASVAPSSVDAFSSAAGVCCEAGRGVCSLIAVSVISFKGVPWRDAASGDSEGLGVGRGGGSSGVSGAIDTPETRLLRAALASFTDRRFGGAFLLGDTGSAATLSGGLKTCEGSTDSLSLVVRRLVLVLEVAATLAVVLRRGEARLLFGAGVYSSSSSSSSCSRLMPLFSMSEEPSSSSKTTFLLEAARRERRSGDAADIATMKARLCCLG